MDILEIEKFKGCEALQHEMFVSWWPIVSQCAIPTMLISHYVDKVIVQCTTSSITADIF